jgi:hypothetical protein
MVRNYGFLGFIFQRKIQWTEATWLKSIVDRGCVDKRARRRLAVVQRADARARWCSPVAMEEDESDEVVP